MKNISHRILKTVLICVLPVVLSAGAPLPALAHCCGGGGGAGGASGSGGGDGFESAPVMLHHGNYNNNLSEEDRRDIQNGIRRLGRRYRNDYQAWLRYRARNPNARYEDFRAWQHRRVIWRRKHRRPGQILRGLAVNYLTQRLGVQAIRKVHQIARRSRRARRIISLYNKGQKARQQARRIRRARNLARSVRRGGVVWGGLAPATQRNVRRWITARRRKLNSKVPVTNWRAAK